MCCFWRSSVRFWRVGSKSTRDSAIASQALLLQRGRLGEFLFVYGDVRFDVVQDDGIAAVEPGVSDAERQLEAVDVFVIAVVDLRGYAPNRTGAVAEFAQQQVCVLIEE